jgi:hypothetical protein
MAALLLLLLEWFVNPRMARGRLNSGAAAPFKT